MTKHLHLLLFRLTIIVTALCMTAGCGSEPALPSAELVLSQLQDTYGAHPSISYTVDYRQRFAGAKDTLAITADVDLIRALSDTILSAYVWIDEDTISRVYDGLHVYIIDHHERSIVQYPSTHPFELTGYWMSGVIDSRFISPERRLNEERDSLNATTFRTVVGEHPQSYVWRCEYPDQGGYTDRSIETIIDKETLKVREHSFWITIRGQIQYKHWMMSDISFDQVTLDDFSDRLDRLKAHYSFHVFDPANNHNQMMSPLAVGDTMPSLHLVHYPALSSSTLDYTTHQYTLIDFWYTSCAPCIKAVPELNEVLHHHSDQGFRVLGLNPFNNNEEDLAYLPTFLENVPIDYPIAFISPKEAAQLPITAYPTIHLVDSDGVIVYSEVGYREGLLQRVDSVLSHKL